MIVSSILLLNICSGLRTGLCVSRRLKYGQKTAFQRSSIVRYYGEKSRTSRISPIRLNYISSFLGCNIFFIYNIRMTSATIPSANQRMFHGTIRSGALADQLAARFNDRQRRVNIVRNGDSALIQIGSKHGTPVTVNIADLEGGVLVTMSRDRNWLDRAADAGDMLERAAASPISLLAMIPDIIGELNEENEAPRIWDAINDIMGLSRALAGEVNAPENPRVCLYCGTSNAPELDNCQACGGALPVDLPRICPKCARAHTAEALFCQACGTRLVKG